MHNPRMGYRELTGQTGQLFFCMQFLPIRYGCSAPIKIFRLLLNIHPTLL